MAATNLHRFSSLPPRIQIFIWSYASNPLNAISVPQFLLKFTATLSVCGTPETTASAFFLITSPGLFGNSHRFRPGVLRSVDIKERERWSDTARARQTLKGVCRLARGVVLEGLRREVGAIELAEGRSKEEDMEERERIVAVLSGLIDDLKCGDRKVPLI